MRWAGAICHARVRPRRHRGDARQVRKKRVGCMQLGRHRREVIVPTSWAALGNLKVTREKTGRGYLYLLGNDDLPQIDDLPKMMIRLKWRRMAKIGLSPIISHAVERKIYMRKFNITCC